jgi:hypothetical protein
VQAAVAEVIASERAAVNGIIQVEIVAFAPDETSYFKLLSDFQAFHRSRDCGLRNPGRGNGLSRGRALRRDCPALQPFGSAPLWDLRSPEGGAWTNYLAIWPRHGQITR